MVHEVISEIKEHLAEVTPLAGKVGRATKGKVKHHEEHLGEKDTGLQCHVGHAVEAVVGRLKVNISK